MLPERQTADLAASFQRVAFQHIEDRLDRAMDYVEREYNNNNDNDSDKEPNRFSLVVVGGVAANQELRRYEGWFRIHIC